MDSKENVLNVHFAERSFEEVEGGYYDRNGWYLTPNGSFWDENGEYFNRDGIDKHFGFYDEFGVYTPGENWNKEYGCYEDEVEMLNKNEALTQIINKNLHDQLLEEYEYYQKFLEELGDLPTQTNIRPVSTPCTNYSPDLDTKSLLKSRFKDTKLEEIDEIDQFTLQSVKITRKNNENKTESKNGAVNL